MFLVCLLYAGFAVTMAVVEIASEFDPTIESKFRELPKLFVLHALTGAIVLSVGPVQFHPGIRVRQTALHRVTGRAYVYGVWVSSGTAAILAPFFDVPYAARLFFLILAVLWFGTTTIGLRRALAGNMSAHREWMIRSFALSLFFITGSFWMEISGSLPWPKDITYPLAVLLGWALNLAAAEWWIRRTGNRGQNSSRGRSERQS
jgi:uncharacterized membrane protein